MKKIYFALVVSSLVLLQGCQEEKGLADDVLVYEGGRLSLRRYHDVQLGVTCYKDGEALFCFTDSAIGREEKLGKGK